jgi:hypothetical protein
MTWAPNYVTSAELATFVRVGDATDTALGYAIAAASRSVDQATGRQFGQVSAPEVRYYPVPRWERRHWHWVAPIDDVMTTVGLVVEFDGAADHTYSTAITDYLLRPLNASAKGRPATELVIHASAANPLLGSFGALGGLAGVGGPYGLREDALRVTARWGWTAVPDAVKEATLLQASRILSRRNSPHGIAGSPEAGSETRLLAKLDPDVMVALRPYCRTRWVA